MILSCLLFLLGRLPASDLVRSLLAGGLWLLLTQLCSIKNPIRYCIGWDFCVSNQLFAMGL